MDVTLEIERLNAELAEKDRRIDGLEQRLALMEQRVVVLERQIQIDAQTGLLNKNAFYGRVEREQQSLRARKEREDHHFSLHPHSRKPHLSARQLSFGVVFIDADMLKWVNDTFTHIEGDKIIKALVDAICHAIRPDDEAARMGGDEFCILLRSADKAAVRNVCRRLIAKLNAEAIILKQDGQDDVPFTVRTSIGGAVWTVGSPTSAVTVVKAADQEMYKYKRDRQEHKPPKLTVREFSAV